MNKSPAIVITSIFQPSPALTEIAKGAAGSGYKLIVIGDANSPPDFSLQPCDYYDLDRQKKTDLRFDSVWLSEPGQLRRPGPCSFVGLKLKLRGNHRIGLGGHGS